MTKSNTARQVLDERLPGAAPVQEQEAAAPLEGVETSGTDADPEPEPEPEKEPLHLVVLAYPGTEDLVRRVWEKFYDLPVRIVTFQESDSLVSLLESVMAMEDVARVFAVIPGNLVPLAPVRWSELQTLRADDLGNGRLSLWGRVPVCFDKEALAEFLPDHDNFDGEAFVQQYFSVFAHTRPELVSHSYGNYLIKVLRANPCESVVIEGLLHKRFLYANAVGWEAVSDLVENLLR